MKRQGLSFTLTLVVIGVVLLMTALTVIVLGNSSIDQSITQAMGYGTDSAIQTECNDIARTIDRVYCDNYVNAAEGVDADGTDMDVCADISKNRQPSHAQTATEVTCDWKAVANQGGAVPALENALSTDAQGELSAIVTVDGDQYNCLDQGYLDTTCPAS